MASPAVFWWSQPSSTSPAQTLEPTPPLPLDPAPPEPKPTSPAPKPKPKKNPKASSSSSSSAKRNPQRGLGVAQLERIRLQDRLKNIAGEEIQQFPASLPSIYEQESLVAASSCPIHVGGGSPFTYATGASSGAICYVPAQYRVGCGYSGGPASAIRSVLHEQYAMDRVRIGSGSVVMQPTSPELPSNQRPAAVCIFDQCEFCLRKRIMSEFSCGNGVDHCFVMDEMERRSFVREREIKEYEFFPHSSSAKSNGGGDLGLGGEPAAAAAASSSATSPGASNFVDLSLKLF